MQTSQKKAFKSDFFRHYDNKKYIERQAISLCGKAIHGWSMIANGDHIAVGLSGGKDSLSLLWLLANRRRLVPINFKITAIHIEMGFYRVSHQALADFCANLEINFYIIKTNFGLRAHTAENREKSPCFFCALHRRRELFQAVARLNCHKLALAHHQDDIFETFLLNSFFAGHLSTMLPVQSFFNGKIILIRPLTLMNADQTRRFSTYKKLPLQPSCCDVANKGQRATMRNLLAIIHYKNKYVRASLWHALTSSGLSALPTKPKIGRIIQA